MTEPMRRVSAADLFKGTEIQEFDIHPNGREAICSVNNGANWELATLDLKTGKLKTFLGGDQSLTSPSYSAAGDRVVYQVDFEGDEDHDVVVIGSDGRNALKITDGVADNYSPTFSPGGKTVAFLSNRHRDIENVHLIGSRGGAIRRLTNEEMPVRDLAWSPDGRLIAHQTGVGDEDTISLIDVERAKTKKILAGRNVEYGLAGAFGPSSPWSPDSRRLLFVSNENDSLDIGAIDIVTMKRKWLVRSRDDKYQPQWSPDGNALAYLEVKDPNLLLKVKRGTRTTIVSPKDGVAKFARWSPDSDAVYFINGSAVRQDEVYASNTGLKTITRLHPIKLPKRNLSYPKLVRFKSFDRREIPALLYMPKDRSRRAGIVLPHGGPEAQTLNEWDQLVQMMTDRGFAVIEPNYRGSTGYGRKYLHLHDRDLGGGDYMDTVFSGKYLIDSGLIDKARLGYWGASYSGFTCMLALTKAPDMWAAGVSIVGFFDWKTEIASERGYLQAYDHKKMGDPDKEPDFFRERSPINFLENLKAPLLMTASARDVRCPPTESRAVVKRLSKLGKKVEYHEYNDEGHWPRKRKNLKDLYERSVRFLDTHIAK